MFKHHRFPKSIILQAVYFKLRFTLSYRDVAELLQIRGVEVDHSTIQRWVFKFSLEVEKNMNKSGSYLLFLRRFKQKKIYYDFTRD